MYARRIRCRNQRWGSLFQQSKYVTRPHCQSHAWSRSLDHKTVVGNWSSDGSLIRKYLLDSFATRVIAPGITYSGFCGRSITCLRNDQLRVYSSEGDGRNASENNCRSVNDEANFDKGKPQREKVKVDEIPCDAHARLGEQDQKEWLNNEKLSIESRKKESPFLTRHEKFKNEFLRRVVPWEKIHVSWETFPYFIHEHSKNLLVECVASHVKHKKCDHKKCATSYGARLTSSSGRIRLQSVPGTELYRERVVRALARDLQVPLLVLDSNVLAPYDFSEDCSSESDDDNVESGEECTSESEVEDENDASNDEEWTSSNEARTDCSDDEVDVQATAEAALKKLVPYNLEEFEKRVSGESESPSASSKSEADESSDRSKQPLKKGDRVKYIGPNKRNEADSRPLSTGQRGEVYEVNGDSVAVIWDMNREDKAKEGDEKLTEQNAESPLNWIDVKDIVHDLDTQADDCYIAIEALCEVLNSMQPLIVYFPDSSQWLSRVPKSSRKEFVHKVQEMFDQLAGPVVLICGQNRVETGSKEKEKFTMILPNFGRLAKLPLPLKRLTEGLKATKRSDDNDIYKLFTNVLCIYPPKEEDLLRVFNKQLEEDRRIVISRSNINELHKVLEENELSCMDLLHVNTDGVILTKRSKTIL